MSSMTPSRIEWRGPGGFTVVLDEHFVSLRGGRCLEESELNLLLDVINEAKRCRDVGAVPIPKPADVPF